MSFILDALRKVDHESRQSDEVVPSVTAVEKLKKERRNRRRQFAAMAAIAMFSAATTAWLLRRPPSSEPASTPPPAQGPAAAVAAPLVDRELPRAKRALPEPIPDRPAPATKIEGPSEGEAPAAMVPNEEPAVAPAEPAPELPRLVLQGTSVLAGRPVAVVSDRRVYEGDRIEGAVVIHIGERSVELEFEGRRFTLTF